MPQVSEYLTGEQDLPTLVDADELDESKPELWPLFFPSQLSQVNRSFCYKGVAETEETLRLAQVQDNLVDLRRLRRTLRSMRMFSNTNLIGEGQKTQTKSRTVESGLIVRTNRAVRRYRLAYSALLSLDPAGDWRKEYLELTDKDNRGPGKELYEQGVGDGRYAMSWIWMGALGGEDQDGTGPSEEVNETVRYEWMTSRARADRWREESDLLQEEMRRVIAFLEWKSSSWSSRVGSRGASVAADIVHGADCYARKQANIYHELALSLANQWLPHLLALGLDVAWTRTYPWTAEIVPLTAEHPTDCLSLDKSSSTTDPLPGKAVPPGEKHDGLTKPAAPDNESGDESDDVDPPETDGEEDEGGNSDGLGIGFDYDDEYMT